MRGTLWTLAALAASAMGQMSPVPKGFVHADGKRFMLDGKPYYFAGTNSYWVQFTQV
jgi:mannan endo-1,4-beta-mannosidase